MIVGCPSCSSARLTFAAEPFEDFGGSPQEVVVPDRGSINTSPQSSSHLATVSEDLHSPESTSAPLPGAKPMRSPGLRLGLGPRTSPIKDEGTTSPISESMPPISRSAHAQPYPGGVKRTKSLMQKFRAMVRQRSGSVESVQVAKVRPGLNAGQRSQSMTGGLARPAVSPGWAEGEYVVEEEELTEEPDDQFADAHEDVFGSARPGELGQWNGTADRRVKSEDRRYMGRR